MKMGRAGSIHRDLGPLFEGRSVAGLGEVQLLERFVDRRDELAFAALVSRHGPMVLGVCRRLLADPLDVEDAFQATFLVLVRRAGSLRRADPLAPWLFGVARKVATRARGDLARRRARERPGAEELAATPGLDDRTRELGRALIEEIARLPGPLRDPVVLCCVEGLSYDEAAARLRTTAPAIRGKLSRGRERLKDRLTRRGFAPTAMTLGAWPSVDAASAAVPSRLLLKAIPLAKAGTFPAGVQSLAEGVIRTMILTKSKILAAALVACGVAGSSVGLNAQDPPPPIPAPIAAPEAELKARSREADRFGQIEKKLDRLIEALEGSKRGQDTVVVPVPTPPAAPAAPEAPAAPLPPTVSFPTTAPEPPTPPQPGMNSMMMGGSMRGIGGPDLGRLELVERKLQKLEERIAKLEQRLGPDEAPEADPRMIVPPRVRPNGPDQDSPPEPKSEKATNLRPNTKRGTDARARPKSSKNRRPADDLDPEVAPPG